MHRIELEASSPGAPLPLSPVSQVQTLPVEAAKRSLPVRVRGVVTAAFRGDRWFSLQDETRGIFVGHPSLSNSFPAIGELWEVTGHTAKGNFAPIIEAEEMQRLGPARLPEPARPSWHELANGSMDVQWVELHGVISGVQSNHLTLLMPEGPLEVQMENYFESELKAFRRAVVRIRGALFAVWNAATREVQVGHVLMRNGHVSVEVPPPDDPFDAPIRGTQDFLLFDAQSAALQPVKVAAQVLCTDGQEIFALDGGWGLRVIASDASTLRPGDLFEAAGYPEISGPSPLLRQALIRKTGTRSLPKPRVLRANELTQKSLEATLVTVEGKLIGTHQEQHSPVLEMQSGGQLFIARVKAGEQQVSLRPGSHLQLTGVYVQTGRAGPLASRVEGFELLVNSPTDIGVLSQPTWWTLRRLGAVVGILLIVLMLVLMAEPTFPAIGLGSGPASP